MGKNGALLRQQKLNKTVYTFTSEQLIEHDKMVRAEYRKEIKSQIDNYSKTLKKQIEESLIRNALQYTMAVPVKVLCEHFNWHPGSPQKWDKRLKIGRFAELVAKEMMMSSDDSASIIKYCRDVYEKYGIMFEVTEE